MKYTLADIMTNNPMTVRKDQTAFEVAEIFFKSDFHHLPVVSKKGKVVGMVSRSDLDQHSLGVSLFVNKQRQEYNDALFQTMLVEYFMTKTLYVLDPADKIEDAYTLFNEHQFRAIPVVKEEELVGIVTPIDLVKPFLKQISKG